MTAHQIIDQGSVAQARARMLPPRTAREAQRVMTCICDPTRFKMVRALLATELAAGDLAIVIERSRSATSHHLRILREADAVQRRREGNVIHYRLSSDISGSVLEKLGKAFDLLATA